MAKKTRNSRDSYKKCNAQPRRGREEARGRGGAAAAAHHKPHREAASNAAVRQVMASDSGAEILYGKHSIKAVLLKRPKDVERLAIAGREEYHQDLIELAHQAGIDVIHMEWPDFIRAGRFTDADKHQGVMALVKERTIYLESELHQLADAKCVLVLDQVSNPQNLATIIRSAAFFHADALLYLKNRAATPTPEVVRFAVGGAEMIDMYQMTNLSRCLETLKELGFNVLGLDERGERTLAQHGLNQKTAFVVGAEGEGLRAKTRQYCSDLVRIPGGATGLESLNAAVATTIALYEFARLSEDTGG
ncbi:MAG: RNA methyltransferase [Rhizobiaceae bacterium]|nr:RNA methyltransferase [Hyphomicrobiales bacterium]NRB31981.1 RNA methyltransferase [Rhizobiaceae bacterium]